MQRQKKLKPTNRPITTQLTFIWCKGIALQTEITNESKILIARGPTFSAPIWA